MYKALIRFFDGLDNKHLYNPGDTFPRNGLEVSEERLAKLSGSNNKLGKPVIEFVEAPKKKRAKKTAE